MSRGMNQRGIIAEHSGACHDDCPHINAMLQGVLDHAVEPRFVLTVNRIGQVECVTALRRDDAIQALRETIDRLERGTFRRFQARVN